MKILSPTEKQIDFVEIMCDVLKITDFPYCSKQFTRKAFSDWISAHVKEYNEIVYNSKIDDEWLYDHCVNDIWTEEY